MGGYAGALQQMKVLHVIGGGEFGGAERHILTLFRAVNPKEVILEAVSLFPAPFAPVAREAGMKVTVLPMRNKLDLGVVWRLKGIVAAGGYDLVHTHGVRANFLGRLAARAVGLPVVTTVHSLLTQDYPSPFSRMVNIFSERLTRGFTARFIAVSGFLAAALEKEGVPRERITVVRNGIEVDIPGKEKPVIFRERFGLPEDAPLVATVGRLHRVKGHRYFVAAAGRVLERHPQARFLVIGSGPERAAIEEQVRRLGLQGKVILTGFIQDVIRHYREFALLVLPSVAEGFGLVVLEALLSGTPVVATRVGGVPEVVRDGETGILVPPKDASALATAIERVLENPAAAQEMAARGRDFVAREFSAARMAAGTLAVYRGVLEADG